MKIYSVYHKSKNIAFTTHDYAQQEAWHNNQANPDDFIKITLDRKGQPAGDEEIKKLEDFCTVKPQAQTRKKTEKPEKLDKTDKDAILDTSTE